MSVLPLQYLNVFYDQHMGTTTTEVVVVVAATAAAAIATVDIRGLNEVK